MGNIKRLYCEDKPEEHICLDENGKANCVRVENMKLVFCDHLNAQIEGMNGASICLDCGKVLIGSAIGDHSADHTLKKVWIMECE